MTRLWKITLETYEADHTARTRDGREVPSPFWQQAGPSVSGSRIVTNTALAAATFDLLGETFQAVEAEVVGMLRRAEGDEP